MLQGWKCVKMHPTVSISQCILLSIMRSFHAKPRLSPASHLGCLGLVGSLHPQLPTYVIFFNGLLALTGESVP